MKNRQVRLLVVDDKAENRESLSRHLEQQGYTITVVEGGHQVLDVIETQEFDLVLLDIDMPGMNGYQMLERLKADNTFCHIPVIMLAAVDEVDSVEKCIEMGAADYLSEPFSPVLLRARIDACLEKQQFRKQLLTCLQEKRDVEQLANDVMSVILPLGVALSAEVDFDHLEERIIQEAMSLCNADAGIFYLRTEDDQLRPAAMRNKTLGLEVGGTTGKDIPLLTLSLYDEETGEPDHSNIATRTALVGETINVPNIYSAEGFGFSSVRSFDSENNYRSISCLASPLKGGANEVIGVLELFNAQDSSTGKVIPFKPYLQQVVNALAVQGSIAINNRLLLKRQEELLKFESELQIGREIQDSFLPGELPEFAGWEIAAYFDPARNVGGDFYDAFPLTQNRRLGFVIADVCDKGVGAALFMGLFRSLIRAFSQQHHSLSWMDALSSGGGVTTARRRSGRRQLPSVGIGALKNGVILTNNYIANNHGESNMFATLFFGMLDPDTGVLTYINGGHELPIMLGPDGVQKDETVVTGPAVGVFPDAEFGIQEAQFDPGDILFAYTDGVMDAEDPGGEKFGRERLLALLEQPVTSAADLLKHVESRLRAHIAHAVQFDDITMLAVRRLRESEM